MSAGKDTILTDPLDLIRLSIDDKIHIKLRSDRELHGTLTSTYAFDQHLSMILGDVEEVITTTEIDDETYEEIVKTTRRKVPFLYVRGDGVIVVLPQLRNES